ncbi:MAG: pirin family protein [Betaproteobacteria bacterium]
MITVRHAGQRLHTHLGWLDSWHTFSFGEHYDPRYMGFRALRVINDDRVAPGQGFGTHPHRDMEILSYVLEGALKHRDSLGTGSMIGAGDVQRMTAGTGVLHSEFNASDTEPVHFIQIWIEPERQRLEPEYEQRPFPPAARRGRLTLLASRDGRADSLRIHQDVDLFSAALAPSDGVSHSMRPDRHAWVQVARGAVQLNGVRLSAGDGAAISNESALELSSSEDSEALLFDLV